MEDTEVVPPRSPHHMPRLARLKVQLLDYSTSPIWSSGADSASSVVLASNSDRW